MTSSFKWCISEKTAVCVISFDKKAKAKMQKDFDRKAISSELFTC